MLVMFEKSLKITRDFMYILNCTRFLTITHRYSKQTVSVYFKSNFQKQESVKNTFIPLTLSNTIQALPLWRFTPRLDAG